MIQMSPLPLPLRTSGQRLFTIPSSPTAGSWRTFHPRASRDVLFTSMDHTKGQALLLLWLSLNQNPTIPLQFEVSYHIMASTTGPCSSQITQRIEWSTDSENAELQEFTPSLGRAATCTISGRTYQRYSGPQPTCSTSLPAQVSSFTTQVLESRRLTTCPNKRRRP